MDAKGRVAIPTKFRDQLHERCGGQIVVTAHPDEPCLIVYPRPQWEEILPQILALPDTNKKCKKMKRLIMGHAVELEVDVNGRILVSPTLRTHAHLDKKLMLIGQGNKLELWGAEAWEQWMSDEDDDGEMPESLQNLNF